MIGAVLKFLEIKKDAILIWMKVGFVIAFLLLAFYAVLMTKERNKAKTGMDVAKGKLEASERLRNAQIDALEKAREEDENRHEFTKSTEKDLESLRDDRPLSDGQRLVAERVRDRYRQKFGSVNTGQSAASGATDDHRAAGNGNAK
ncbi:MAG: hypothetical protein IAE63_06745 [Alphaproteobacteria bacterium]|nr:hypothetical protein [Alphaproteobacteria bacterium]